MKIIYRQVPLYTFLNFCNKSELPREVLDCGAGGDCPPLGLFAEQGYNTWGVELDPAQLELAMAFSRKHDLDLNIIQGDIRELPYADQSISHAFCYNTIFHLSKANIARVIGEIKRVMRPEGLVFVNFMSVEDATYGNGEMVGEGEYLQQEGDEQVLHCYHHLDEPEGYLSGFTVKMKEIRCREWHRDNGQSLRWGYIDYILQKNRD